MRKRNRKEEEGVGGGGRGGRRWIRGKYKKKENESRPYDNQ